MSFWSLGANVPKAQDVKWRRNARDEFHRLMMMEMSELDAARGVGGVYVLWHGGVRPRWIMVAESDDVQATLLQLKRDPEIRQYEVNGGVYVTWSPIVPDFRDGVIHYLDKQTEPLIESDYDDREKPIPVYLPG